MPGRAARFAPEGGLGLLSQRLLLAPIAWRIVERADALDASAPADLPCLAGREMTAAGGVGCVCFEKSAFDEEDVRSLGKVHNSGDVVVGEGDVDHIGDLAACGDAHDLALEAAEGQRA